MVLKQYLLLFLFFTTGLAAQTIKGKITTTDNTIPVTANIIIKDSANARGVKEFAIARNGNYEIVLKKNVFQHIYRNSG